MKFFVSGGTGFIGNHLGRFLLDRGHHVVAVGTSSRHGLSHGRFRYISADITRPGDWQDALKDVDVVVNLAGKSIFKRWTAAYKNQIYESRILSTRRIVESLPVKKRIIFLSASGVGFYGSRGDELLAETESGGHDFLSSVSRDWEAEAVKAESRGHRVVHMRFGIVLGKEGGALEKMIPAFRFFVGGPIGAGTQWFSWIHIEDLLSGILFVTEHAEISRAVNFSSPNPVQNRELAKTLGGILSRPSLMPAPAFLVRLVLGEFAEALLSSQRVIPEKLMQHGFAFQHPDLAGALLDIFRGY